MRGETERVRGLEWERERRKKHEVRGREIQRRERRPYEDREGREREINYE